MPLILEGELWDQLEESGKVDVRDIREKAEILVDSKFGKYEAFQKLGNRLKDFFNLEAIGEKGSQKFWKPKDWSFHFMTSFQCSLTFHWVFVCAFLKWCSTTLLLCCLHDHNYQNQSHSHQYCKQSIYSLQWNSFTSYECLFQYELQKARITK